MNSELLVPHHNIGMKCMQQLFDDFGIGYLYRPTKIPTATLSYLFVIDLLKHCSGLIAFKNMLLHFLRKYHGFVGQKEEKSAASPAPAEQSECE